jgi:hypothetical protein
MTCLRGKNSSQLKKGKAASTQQCAYPASYTLIESKSSPSGVIIATFKRAGEVETGSF